MIDNKSFIQSIGNAQKPFHPLTKNERDYASMNIKAFWKDCIDTFVRGAKYRHKIDFSLSLSQGIEQENFFFYRLNATCEEGFFDMDNTPCVNIRLFLPEMHHYYFSRRKVEAWGYDSIIIATSINEANTFISRLRKPFKNNWLSFDRNERIKKCECGIIHINPGSFCNECNGDTPNSVDDGAHLYFMTDGYKIKIGKSKHPKKRARQISTQVGEKVTVIKTVKNGGKFEKAIHRHLAQSKKLGEWFEPTNDVLLFIENAEDEINKLFK